VDGGVGDHVKSVDDAVARLVGEPGRTASTSGAVSVPPDVRGLVLIQGLLPRAARGAWPNAPPELVVPVPGRRFRICSWQGQRHRLAR